MEISIYKKERDLANSIEFFLDFYYSIQMQCLASDLLKEGLSPIQISEAVLKAIKIAKSSGIDVRKHFMPVFTEMNKEVINDCKLSELGYGLILLNANTDLASVRDWQLKILKTYLN